MLLAVVRRANTLRKEEAGKPVNAVQKKKKKTLLTHRLWVVGLVQQYAADVSFSCMIINTRIDNNQSSKIFLLHYCCVKWPVLTNNFEIFATPILGVNARYGIQFR